MNNSPPLITPATKRVMNLSHILRQAARRHGAQIGFVWGERIWSWAELDRRVDAMVTALTARGIRKGDRVLGADELPAITG